MSDRRTRQIRQRLLAWYDEHGRDLPWRRTRDPYAIWVSEIMAQQTRIDTVIPYYQRFLERFPTADRLAEAPEDEVMALWSGLGYYRRARLLHAGARAVVEEHAGSVPEDPEARRKLPGVGRYTAGAIGSISFGREEAVVDGNVMRVLARLEGIDTPIGRADTERAFWSRAEDLVQGERPGDFNQSLMEFGARVCTPSQPSCDACPLRRLCVAYKEERVQELPVPRPRKAPKPVDLSAVVAFRQGRLGLLRSEGKLFGGLFGPPMSDGHGRQAARSALRDAGLSGRLGREPVSELEHVLSHRRLTVQVWKATGARLLPAARARLVGPEELKDLGLSTLSRKVIDSALD